MIASRKLSGVAGRLSVVGLVVVVNLLSLPLVVAGSGFLAQQELAVVTSREKTAGLLELGDDEDNVETTHNLFIELNQAAEGADLLVLGGPPELHRGRRFRARLVGIMRPASMVEIEDADAALMQEVIETASEADHMHREGVVWELPGHARNDRPGHQWEMMLASHHPDSIVLVAVKGEHEPRWFAIDDDLLPPELRGRIWPW